MGRGPPSRERWGYRQCVRRLLAPRWLAGHALVVLLFILFCRLGWWQWERAAATGRIQNLIYALQWPSFAIFGVVMWGKTLHDELTGSSAGRRRAYAERPPARAYAVPSGEPEDEELAAYNRYLAWLNARDEQRSR